MNRIVSMFLARPRLAIALTIAALIAGALALASLPVAFFPTVSRPTISVSCTYPGANAIEVMNTVAGPLEDRVNGVEGFDHMTSSCADTGSYSLTVYFQAGYDRDLALMKVQAAVQQALTQLPQEVKNTGVTVGIGQTIDLGYVTCYSERGELTRDEVVDYMFGVVSPAIMRVQGVGASSVQDEKIAVRVWLDSDRMAAQGIGTDEIVAAVKAQNVQASLGTVGSSPVVDPKCRVLSLIAKGRLQTPAEFGAMIVRTRPDGGIVYLRDVARIELGHETYAHAGMFGDKPACVTHLYQLPGANTLKTVAGVKDLLTRLEKRFPGDLRWDMTVDVSRYSESALGGARFALLASAALAFLVLLVAFRSPRRALVTLAATAVALALVVTILAAFGFFLTVLSLYAITAAFAFMTVTFASVLSAGKAGRLREGCGAALAAGLAVSATALVLLLAGGVQGIIMRQFAIVFAAAGFATSFVAVAIVPVFGGMRLASIESVPPREGGGIGGRFGGLIEAALPRFVALAAVAALLLGACAIARRMPRDLVPNEDFGVVLVDVKTKEGTSRPQVAEIVSRLRTKIASACTIEKSCTVFGEGIFSPSGENVAKMYLVLKPWAERKRGDTTLATIARIRAVVSDIPEAQVSLMSLPTVPGMGSANYVSPLVLSTADNDPVRLSQEAHRLQAIMKRSPLADDVTCGYNTDSPHLRIVVDRAKCETLKVPLSSLFSTLQHYLGSIYVNDVNLGTQVNRVTVMCDWKGRAAPATMAGLYVKSSTGAMVPVSALVDMKEELGPNAVYRYNRYLYCTVDMAQKAGVSLQDTMAEITRIFDRELPRDYDTGWSGIAYEESSNPGHTDLVIALALLAAFFVLLVRYESWRKAAFDFLPAAAAVFGGVATLWATGVSLSLYSRFALVMLAVMTAVMPRKAGFALLAAALALPLVFTTGAGAAGSRSFGMTLVGGYLVFALFGLPLARGLGAKARRAAALAIVLLAASTSLADTPKAKATQPVETTSVSRMESRTNDPKRDPGIFGDYWWANRFLSRHRLVEKYRGQTVDLVMVGDSIIHFWEWHHPKSWSAFCNGRKVLNLGYGGDRTENVLWRIDHGELDGYTARRVVIMIGTNNNSFDKTNPANVAAGIEKIVARVKEKQPKAEIVLHPIFPRGNGPTSKRHAAARARNDRTNALLKEFAVAHPEIRWIDFNAKLVDETGWVPASLMADQIHPTDAGYVFWAEALKFADDAAQKK